MFIKTANGKVYSSNTNGATFVDQTAGLLGAGNNDVLQVVYQEGSESVILQGWGANNWATRDMGDSWIQPCGLPGVSDSNCFSSPVGDSGGYIASLIRMHPHDPNKLLALVARKTCVDEDEVGYEVSECGRDLMYSPDFGRTWQNLRENSAERVAGFVDFDWAPAEPPRLDAPAILATVYEDQSHVAAGAHKAWDYNVHFVFSQDLFKSPHERRLTCGNSFEVLSGRDVYVAQLSDCEAYHGASKEDKDAFKGTDVALRVSTDGGRNFKRACFPVGLRQRGFTIFDWNEGRDGADFIAVDHDEEDAAEAAAPMGNVYSSDASGQLYSISLRRNLYFGGAVDFINVEGIEGVFIANQIANDAFVSPEGVAGGSPEDFVKTRISFNGGGAWQPVKAPAVDVTGKPITCHSDDCELHLHGASHWQRGTWKTRLGSVYSQPSAPGVVLATGNVGEYLSGDAQIVNTFLSRDAGATWTEILKGPHIYEFGNHGGLIVVAKMAALGPTTKVQFSRDEGRSWEDVPLQRAINVHNIRVDPDGAGTVFVIHGTDAGSTEGDGDAKGLIYTLDFSKLNDRSGNHWTFGRCDTEKDYEWWNPAAPGESNGCILGRKYEMERRRQDACCLNDHDYERTATKETTCACDKDFDTECQFGSERMVELGECERMESVDLDRCPALVGQRYPNSNKRIIAGSACSGGHAALGVGSFVVGEEGKKRGRGGGSGVGTFFLVLLFLGAFAGGGYWAYNQYDLGRFVPQGVRDTVNGLKDNIDELLGRKTPTPAGYFEPLGDFGGEEF